eukprot:340754_1
MDIHQRIVDDSIDLQPFVLLEKNQRFKSIERSMKIKKQWIQKCFNEQKNKETIIFTLFDDILNDTLAVTKEKFYQVSIENKVDKYPSLQQIVKDWINSNNNNLSMSIPEIKRISINHLNEIIVDVFPVALLAPDIEIIKSKHRQFATQAMENKIESNGNSLWVDDNECKYYNTPSNLFTIEQNSCKQLQLIIETLCENIYHDEESGTNFESILFINLLKLKFEEINELIMVDLSTYFVKLRDVWKRQNEYNADDTNRYCNSHKQYVKTCIECNHELNAKYILPWKQKITKNKNISDISDILKYLSTNIQSLIDIGWDGDDHEDLDSEDTKILDDVINDALIIYQSIFNTNEKLKIYLVNNLIYDDDATNIIKQKIKNLLKDVDYCQKLSDLAETNNVNNILEEIQLFYQFIFTSFIKELYKMKPELLTDKLSHNDALEKIQIDSEEWLNNGIIPQFEVAPSNKIYIDEIINTMNNMFNDKLYDKLPINHIKTQFIQFAQNTIKDKLNLNKTKHSNTLLSVDTQMYAERAKEKMKMPSVKKLKALWYQCINENHQILPNQQISYEHVFALVLYTDCTQLCTAFRETYRKILDDFSDRDQIERHSLFANLARLLYEAYVFFGSIDSKITQLYHGMSVPLLFETMYCVFNAPTSTTTSSSVAINFGGGSGIILNLESNDSEEYIKTVDMNLFSPYDTEEEHLIYQSKLHIKDIFMAMEQTWIGKNLMNILCLYDGLVTGNIINDALLKKSVQRKTVKTIQQILNGNEEATKSKYVNSLIKSVMVKRNKIWLNVKQIMATVPDLQNMFVTDDGSAFGTFISYLKQQHNIYLCPMIMMTFRMNKSIFDIVRPIENNFAKKQICVSEIMRCNLPGDKCFVFQSYVSQIGDLIDVEMKLLSSPKNYPVKIHFDIHFGDYHKSFHPKEMDVQYDNTFHVTIPTIKFKHDESSDESTMSLFASIHNVEQLGINIHELGQANCQVASDMAGYNSNFSRSIWSIYGIFNSVISIMESISNIILVLHLLKFSTEHETITKIIHFVLSLAMGNLLYVAICIGLYMAIEMTTKYILFCGYSIVFFILSPVLTGFQWILQNIPVDHTPIPGSDNLLTCIYNERASNRMFIIEAVLESCFQILIQFSVLFVLQEFEQIYSYLKLSIIISLLAIASKFILISYNSV